MSLKIISEPGRGQKTLVPPFGWAKKLLSRFLWWAKRPLSALRKALSRGPKNLCHALRVDQKKSVPPIGRSSGPISTCLPNRKSKERGFLVIENRRTEAFWKSKIGGRRFLEIENRRTLLFSCLPNTKEKRCALSRPKGGTAVFFEIENRRTESFWKSKIEG